MVLEPEEWVRQHVLHHLNAALGYPLGCMSVEHQLTLNGMSRRADIVAFTPDGTPRILVECKAPNVALNQDAVSQAARYNLVLRVPVLLVTNGLKHAAFGLDDEGTLPPSPNFRLAPAFEGGPCVLSRRNEDHRHSRSGRQAWPVSSVGLRKRQHRGGKHGGRQALKRARHRPRQQPRRHHHVHPR